MFRDLVFRDFVCLFWRVDFTELQSQVPMVSGPSAAFIVPSGSPKVCVCHLKEKRFANSQNHFDLGACSFKPTVVWVAVKEVK